MSWSASSDKMTVLLCLTQPTTTPRSRAWAPGPLARGSRHFGSTQTSPKFDSNLSHRFRDSRKRTSTSGENRPCTQYHPIKHEIADGIASSQNQERQRCGCSCSRPTATRQTHTSVQQNRRHSGCAQVKIIRQRVEIVFVASIDPSAASRKMECERASTDAKWRKLLACGCRRICSCGGAASAAADEDPSRQSGAPSRRPSPPPWMSPWFGDADEEAEACGRCRRGGGGRRHAGRDDGTGAHRMSWSRFPTQMPMSPILPPSPISIGHPSLQIYKFRLPRHLLKSLDHIVHGCQEYAARLPSGWK